MIKFLRSVLCCLAGIVHVVRSEANMRWHVAATVLVTIAGLFFGISETEWSLVILCIGLVMGAECINTSIERLSDRVTDEQDLLIRQSKDAAAGAVLIVSIVAAIVGAIIFIPKAWAMLG